MSFGKDSTGLNFGDRLAAYVEQKSPLLGAGLASAGIIPGQAELAQKMNGGQAANPAANANNYTFINPEQTAPIILPGDNGIIQANAQPKKSGLSSFAQALFGA